MDVVLVEAEVEEADVVAGDEELPCSAEVDGRSRSCGERLVPEVLKLETAGFGLLAIGGFEDFFVKDTFAKKLPADIRDRVFRKLQMIDDATTDADLRIPPSNRFERLSGSLEGFCSIRVNDRWRLIFRWNGSDASDIYLDDHLYR